MANISVDNGNSYTTPAKAIKAVGFDTIVNMMDDDTREDVHNKFAPCTDATFLREYLKRAKDDLIIG